MSKLEKPDDNVNDAATVGSAETLDREELRDSKVNKSHQSLEKEDNEQDLQAPKIESIGDFCRAIVRQFKITEGMLISMWFIFMITFIFFPGILDATNLTFMDKINNNEASWF